MQKKIFNKNFEVSLSSRTTVQLAVFIFFTALFIRIQYIKETTIISPIRADAYQYVTYGYNLVRHHTFSMTPPSKIKSEVPKPDAYRSPGYPLLIALSIMLGGKANYYQTIIFIQIFLSALSAFLTFLIADYFLPKWLSLAASFFVAINPHLIAMSSYVLSETLFSFILLMALWFFILAVNYRNLIIFIFSGFFFGIAYLTNESAFFIPYLLALLLIVSQKSNTGKPRYNAVGHCILFLIVFSIFPGGWILRSHFSLPPDALRGSDHAIRTISNGSYPGFIYKNPEYRYYAYREDPMQPEYGASLENFSKIFWKRFKERPLRYISWYFIESPYYFWSWNDNQSQMGMQCFKGQGDVYVYQVSTSLYFTSDTANLTRILMKILHPFFLMLSLTGIFLMSLKLVKKRRNEMLLHPVTPVFIVIVYYTALYSLFGAYSRYSVPFRPELILFSLWSLQTVYNLLFKKLS